MARSSSNMLVMIVVGVSIAGALGFVAASVIVTPVAPPAAESTGDGASPEEIAKLQDENRELRDRLDRVEVTLAALEAAEPSGSSTGGTVDRSAADRLAKLEARVNALSRGGSDSTGDGGAATDGSGEAALPDLGPAALETTEFDSAVRRVIERLEEEERLREEAEEYAEDLERYQEMTTYLADFVPKRLEEMSTVLQLDATQREAAAAAMELRKNQLLIRMNPDTPRDDPNRMGWREIHRGFEATMREVLTEQQYELFEEHDFDDFD